MKDLAVLFPCFNGGDRLRQSVESCAAAGLPPEKYGLIVLDNCSTDGSIELLPREDANNVPIQIYRNERNLGRVGNWNRALEVAERQGFRFATFVFVGDRWAPASSIQDLLDVMLQNEAVLGMAPIRIVGKNSRDGARISIPGDSALVDSERLLEHVVHVGRVPFAPIQANIYRLFSDGPLRFDDDPNYALNTDIEATAIWMRNHPGRVALMATPFLIWNGYSGRFLNKQDPWYVFLETRASLQRIAELTGTRPDWASANAVSLLTSARELSAGRNPVRRLAFLYRVAQYLRRRPGGLGIRKLRQFTAKKLLHNQSYLSFPEDSPLLLNREGIRDLHRTPILTRYGL